MMRAGLLCIAVLVSASTITAVGPPTNVEARAKKAKKVVVATVTDVDSSFSTNRFGDQLIVSRVTVNVEETLKGQHADVVALTVEGGTVGDLTLRVSDLPEFRRGERAVLFLDGDFNDHQPTDRGDGVLKLDSAENVFGTNVSLDTIRRSVRAAGK
jgi:hypothetical protein